MIIRVLFCAAALVFPFSVALTNIFLGVGLVFAILTGFWWQGAKLCWEYYKHLTIVFCIYMFVLLLGLLWSLDIEWGLHVLGRHWFWLLIPALMALFMDAKWRKYFLILLSLALALNLVFCVLQMFGYVAVTTDGSSAEDATGHIGHIGFGFVYGLWAAWLLHLGLLWRGSQRWVVWGLAGWSYVMVFSAQGRSGYLIALVLMLCVLIKWVLDTRNWRAVLPVVAGLVLILLVIALGPGKERLYGTWLVLTQAEQQQHLDPLDSSDNAIMATQARFYMWQTSLDIGQQYPLLGVGTGGLPQAVALLKEQGLSTSSFIFVHPHNQYLLNLIRWGPLGLLLLLALLFFWLREGLVRDWHHSYTAPLFVLTALALAVHGLSSSSLEEHFSGVLAVLLLGVALAGNKQYSVAE